MFWNKKENNENELYIDSLLRSSNDVRCEILDIKSEITEIRKEFRNQLEAEKRKNKDLLTEVLSNPPKYKAEDAVFYGDKKYFVYNIKNIKDGDYLYNIYLKDGEGCVVYGSVINDVSERALYTRNKK